MNDLKKDITSVLLPSMREGILPQHFAQDFEMLLCSKLEPQKYGFNNVVELLKSIPDVCCFRDGRCFPVISGSENYDHISSMIVKQKKKKKSKAKKAQPSKAPPHSFRSRQTAQPVKNVKGQRSTDPRRALAQSHSVLPVASNHQPTRPRASRPVQERLGSMNVAMTTSLSRPVQERLGSMNVAVTGISSSQFSAINDRTEFPKPAEQFLGVQIPDESVYYQPPSPSAAIIPKCRRLIDTRIQHRLIPGQVLHGATLSYGSSFAMSKFSILLPEFKSELEKVSGICDQIARSAAESSMISSVERVMNKEYVVVCHQSLGWCRARVSKSSDAVSVTLIDYGLEMPFLPGKIFRMPDWLYEYPPLSTYCKLGSYSESAFLTDESSTFQIRILNDADDVYEIVLYESVEPRNVSRRVVSRTSSVNSSPPLEPNVAKERIPECGKFSGKVSCLDDHFNCCITLAEKGPLLSALEQELCVAFENGQLGERIWSLQVGMVGVVVDPDEECYRAQLTDFIESENCYRIFFLDYGEYDKINTENMQFFPLPSYAQAIHLRFQAIKVKLHDFLGLGADARRLLESNRRVLFDWAKENMIDTVFDMEKRGSEGSIPSIRIFDEEGEILNARSILDGTVSLSQRAVSPVQEIEEQINNSENLHDFDSIVSVPQQGIIYAAFNETLSKFCRGKTHWDAESPIGYTIHYIDYNQQIRPTESHLLRDMTSLVNTQ